MRPFAQNLYDRSLPLGAYNLNEIHKETTKEVGNGSKELGQGRRHGYFKYMYEGRMKDVE